MTATCQSLGPSQSRSRPRRQPFTLIEVLIAFGLVSILITTLMSFYWQFAVMQIEGEHLRNAAFRLRYLQNRLSFALLRTVSPQKEVATKNGEAKPPDYFFYTSEVDEGDVFNAPSLVFTYDNGIDINPLFCNEVLARLYRVQDQLWLATWPRPSCSKDVNNVRRELLMTDVEALQFQFYQPPPIETTAQGQGQTKVEPAALPKTGDKPDTKLTQTVDEPQPEWDNTTWKQAFKQLPAIVKVKIKLKGQSAWQDLYVPIANSDKPIVIKES